MERHQIIDSRLYEPVSTDWIRARVHAEATKEVWQAFIKNPKPIDKAAAAEKVEINAAVLEAEESSNQYGKLKPKEGQRQTYSYRIQSGGKPKSKKWTESLGKKFNSSEQGEEESIIIEPDYKDTINKLI